MDLVNVINTGDKPLTLRHDALGDVTIAPGGARIVSIQIALVAFGNPQIRNEGNRRYREDEYSRLRVQWGFYAGLMSEEEWDETCPRFECRNLEGDRVYFILDDPDGTLNTGVTLTGQSDDATLQQQVTELQAQLAQVTRLLSGENTASTPSKPAAATTDAILGDDDDDDDDGGYPIPTGSGWYELSDGSKVQGEERAVSAQAALDALNADPDTQTIPHPAAEAETQESRNEARDNIPKPADDDPVSTEDSPRTTRVGSASGIQ